MSDVFVVGALHLDVVVDAPRLPALDETLIGERVAYRFGGKGGNQALAAARIGAQVAMAGRVGNDGFGTIVLETLARSQVDHSQVLRVNGATGMSVAIVESGGEYGAVVVSGVNQTIDTAEVDPGEAKIILLQNEVPESVNLAIAKTKRPGTQIVLNAAPARECSEALLRAVDVLVVNRIEAAQMSGQPDCDSIEAVKALASLGPRNIVVTEGSKGAVVFDGKSSTKISPPIQAEGSAHGAGDAFVGALASQLATGSDLILAVSFAATAAAHFVQTLPEARQSITKKDLQDWIARL